MAPPRNRQPRPPRHRAPPHSRSHSTSNHPRVPASALVQPGIPVSITLKQDQGTGWEVQGIVAEVLTRGDHPRGVKVRMWDGRVGRVQRICDTVGEEMVGDRQDGDCDKDIKVRSERRQYEDDRGTNEGKGRGRNRFFDAEDGGGSETQFNLGDYIVEKKKGKSKVHGAGSETREDGRLSELATSTCPVCGEFEGDKTAVAYHVEDHFKLQFGSDVLAFPDFEH